MRGGKKVAWVSEGRWKIVKRPILEISHNCKLEKKKRKRTGSRRQLKILKREKEECVRERRKEKERGKCT